MLDVELDFLLAATHVAECSSGSFLLAALWYPCAALPSESLVHLTPEGPGGPGEHSLHGDTVESTPGTQERRVLCRPCSCSCSTYVRRQDHFPNLVAPVCTPHSESPGDPAGLLLTNRVVVRCQSCLWV